MIQIILKCGEGEGTAFILYTSCTCTHIEYMIWYKFVLFWYCSDLEVQMEVQDNPYKVLWYQKSSFIQVLVIAHCQVKKILLELLEPMSAACRGAEMFSDTLACIPLFRTMRSVVPCILKHWHIGSRLYQGTGTMQLLHRFTQWQNAESCSVV